MTPKVKSNLKASGQPTPGKLLGIAEVIEYLGILGAMDPQALAQRGANFNPEKQTPEAWVNTSRYGRTAAVKLDPMEMQEEFQVEPEAGSYLAVDDDLRRQAAMGLEQIAMAAPDVIDHRKVVRFHLSTIRGIGNPDDYIIPENPHPGPPPAKINISAARPPIRTAIRFFRSLCAIRKRSSVGRWMV